MQLKKLKPLKPLVTNPKKQSREKRAAFIKEQIYGSLTLLAVNVGLLLESKASLSNALVTVTSTAGGLWLASLVAAVIAYRVVHDKKMPWSEFIHELTVHRGILVSAIPSLLMLGLASIELIEVRTAIIASIALGIVAMSVAILRSAKTSSNSYTTAFISIGIQIVVAALIIFIKLGEK